MYDRNCTKAHIEYIWIIRIQIDPFPIDIALSIQYSKKTINNIIVTGIHLNKELLIYRHQLVPYRACNQSTAGCCCFDHYQCPITNLKIGNIDEDLNKIKDLYSRLNTIQQNNGYDDLNKIKDLQSRLNKEKEKSKTAESKIYNLNQEIIGLQRENRDLTAKLGLKNVKSNHSNTGSYTYGHYLNSSITSTVLSDSCDIDEHRGKTLQSQNYSSDTVSSSKNMQNYSK